MIDQIQEWLLLYPYLGVVLVFLLCGIGLPLPEEITLLAAGYACATLTETTTLPVMMACAAGAILAGDLIPFLAGRVFGTRLLRVRWMRMLVTRRRLSTFDRWFRRRGDMVILVARFVAGLRVVAFFTAGVMKMGWGRFLLLDGLGIAIGVPIFTWLGYHSKDYIDQVIANVQRVERGILWAVIAAGVVILVWLWTYRRRLQLRRRRRRSLAEAYVQPSKPVQAKEAEEAEGDENGEIEADSASEGENPASPEKPPEDPPPRDEPSDPPDA